MKITVIIAVLTINFIPVPGIADSRIDLSDSEFAKLKMKGAGFGNENEFETRLMVKGECHYSLIFPPRGWETVVFAVAIDSGTTVAILIYNDANGNLIDSVTSNKPNLVCRFTPEGGLYRVKVKVLDAEIPTSIRLVSTSRPTEIPLTTKAIASIKP